MARVPIGRWIAAAWRRFGWKQVALAAVLQFVVAALGPNGGVFFFPGVPSSDPIADFLMGRWIARYLPIIFAAMVADEAYKDGVRPLAAYGCALIAGALLGPLLNAVATLTVFGSGIRTPTLQRLVRSASFLFMTLLTNGGLCMIVYAYWRTTQRALQRVQASESQRMRDRQRLIAERLMTLQSRVEPQFLFDALTRVGALQEHDAAAADNLLTDLIALLRAMLPSGTEGVSTVEREFALAVAWLRVHEQLGQRLEIAVLADADAKRCELGPMLVLPMLQMAVDRPEARASPWRLEARIETLRDGDPQPRLIISLGSASLRAAQSSTATPPRFDRLLERVGQLYGSSGRCLAGDSGDKASIVLDLPATPAAPQERALRVMSRDSVRADANLALPARAPDDALRQAGGSVV